MFMNSVFSDALLDAGDKSNEAPREQPKQPKRRDTARSNKSFTRSLRHKKSVAELPGDNLAHELPADFAKDFKFELPAEVVPISPASSSTTSPRLSTYGIPPAYEERVPFSVGNIKESYMTPAELNLAKELLVSRRSAELQTKSVSKFKRAFTTTKKVEDSPFTRKEINRAIHTLLDDKSVSIGLIEALLSLRSDIGGLQRSDTSLTRTSSHTTSSEPEITTADILCAAAQRQRSEVVTFLALRSEQNALDAALPIAIDRGENNTVKALLSCGASAESCEEKLFDALRKGDSTIAHSLLRAKKPPSSEICSSGLSIAVTSGSPREIIRLLLGCGANADHRNAEALQSAVENLDGETCTILARAGLPPSPTSLDTCVGILNYKKVPDQKLKYVILKALIEGPENATGAKGPAVVELLLKAVEQNDEAVVNLILHNLADPDDLPIEVVGEEVLAHAVRNAQENVLRLLLSRQPPPAVLDRIIPDVFHISHSGARVEIAKLLLQAGARGVHVAQALVDAVELLNRSAPNTNDARANASLARMLIVDGQADVDFKNGQALRAALKSAHSPLVDVMLQRRPSQSTFAAALPVAIESLRLERNLDVVFTLIQYVEDGAVIDNAMVQLLTGDHPDAELLHLLTTKATALGSDGTGPARAAVQRGDLELLENLLGDKPTAVILTAALGAITSLNVKGSLDIALSLLERGARGPPAVDLVCMAGNMFDPNVLHSICRAIGTDAGVFSAALGEATGNGDQWLEPRNADVIQIMLDHGASGEVVHLALIQALNAYRSGKEYDHIIDLLISHGASVNHENGESLQLAAEIGRRPLLEKLLAHRASGFSIMRALAAAILAHHDEDHLLDLLDCFKVVKASTLDLDFACPGMDPPMFLCIHAYPDSSRLVRKLRDMGCKMTGKVEVQVYSNDSGIIMEDLVEEWTYESQNSSPQEGLGWRNTRDSACTHWSWEAYEDLHQQNLRNVAMYDEPDYEGQDPEEADLQAIGDSISALLVRDERPVTYFCTDCAESPTPTSGSSQSSSLESIDILKWALIQQQRRVSSDVIATLVECGGMPIFIFPDVTATDIFAAATDVSTPQTRATPLILAARNNHAEAVARLLRNGAKVNDKDSFNLAALNYAARSGSLAIIEVLLANRARTNDGSLHEASRSCHSRAIEALLNAGHDSNYRSSKHDGRTPLAELARKASSCIDEADVEDAVEILVEHGADSLMISNDKTVLYHALDNPDTLFVTRILLERALWKTVADPRNTHQRGDFIYSPSQYIVRDVYLGAERDKWELIRMLKNHGAEDRYHAVSGIPQPPDAINVPQTIFLDDSPTGMRPAHIRRPSEWTREQRDQRHARHEREAGFRYQRQQRQLQLAFLANRSQRAQTFDRDAAVTSDRTMTKFQRTRMAHLKGDGRNMVSAIEAARTQRGMSLDKIKAKRMESVKAAKSDAFRRFSRS